MYTDKLSGALSSSNCEEGAQAKLELVLDMLALSHLWDMSDLHEHLQNFIINDPGFINPYWVRRSTSAFHVAGFTCNRMSSPVREHAEATTATHLADYCRKYEEHNKSVIDDFADNGSEDEFSDQVVSRLFSHSSGD